MALSGISRRGLLLGRSAEDRRPRPPWAREGAAFTDRCTACDACIDACPEQVLVAGRDGLPVFDPQRGECTFCQDCVGACQPQALSLSVGLAWPHRAQVADTCLPARGVICASCRDVCPETAIRLPLGGRGGAVVDTQRCSGCGACVGVCPVQAISLQRPIEVPA